MKQFNRTVRGRRRDRLVNFVIDGYSAHGLCRIGQSFCHRHDVWDHAEGIGTKRCTQAPKPTNDFVEDQHNAVVIANLPQALKISLGWNQTTCGPGYGLDDTSRDGIGPKLLGQPFEVFCEFHPCFWLTFDEAILWQPRMAHVGNARQTWPERLAIFHQSAQGHTRHIDTVIGPFPRYESVPLPFTACVVIGVGNLNGSLHSFRAGIPEENVVKARRGQRCDPPSQLERQGLGQLKWRHIGKFLQLRINSFCDLGSAVSGGTAEQPG